MTDKLKCPKCGKQALYYRTDGTCRCNRCNWEGPAMMQEKATVPAEQNTVKQ